MCYSASQSITALVVNVVSCLITFILLFKGQIHGMSMQGQLMAITVFFLFVGGMQLWDAVFWLTKKTGLINRAATKVAMVWNHLEPIVLALTIIYLMGQPLKQLSKVLITCYAIGCTMYSIMSFLKLKGKGTGQTSTSGESLFWEWNYMPYASLFYGLFVVTLLTLVYQHFTGWIKWLSVGLIFTSFLFSVLKYQIVNSIGRYWCYMAAFAPMIYTIIYLNASSKTN